MRVPLDNNSSSRNRLCLCLLPLRARSPSLLTSFLRPGLALGGAILDGLGSGGNSLTSLVLSHGSLVLCLSKLALELLLGGSSSTAEAETNSEEYKCGKSNTNDGTSSLRHG